MFKVLTAGQWKEWLEWKEIRGPVGPDRFDFYTSYIAMHAGGPYENPKDVTLDKFQMPWSDEDPETKARAGR